jgi:hypothetical protein
MLALVEASSRQSAQSVRSLLAQTGLAPAVFRAALTSVAVTERDAWLDLVFGLDAIPDDGPDLPRGCVPYLPCSVDALLRLVDHAGVHDSDVFVDVGAGVGRAAALVHLLTGAPAIGIEIQRALVLASQDLTSRLNVSRCAQVEGDAAQLTGLITIGSVFFLYCPFSGERLEQVLDGLEAIARTRPIRVCCVDLPPLARPWLTPAPPVAGDLIVYRSTLHEAR